MTKNVAKAITPIVEQQAKIQQAAAPLIRSLREITNSSAVHDFQRATSFLSEYKDIANAAMLSSVALNTEVKNLVSDVAKASLDVYNSDVIRFISQAAQTIMPAYTSAIKEIANSPALQWISSIDFSPLKSMLEDLQIGKEVLEYYNRLNKVCLVALYECKWFPYASWSADFQLVKEIYSVLSSSRGTSKRREKRIDRLILGYYTARRLQEMKRSWRESDLAPHIKKILCQAVDAHIQGKYVLTITCLSTMWEGLIHHKLHITGRYGQKKTGQGLVNLIEENNLDPVFGEFYANLIVCDCNTTDEVVDGIPNRNGVSHSKYKKYPSKKASLNAILITDFIIHLEPKQEMEESANGQP